MPPWRDGERLVDSQAAAAPTMNGEQGPSGLVTVSVTYLLSKLIIIKGELLIQLSDDTVTRDEGEGWTGQSTVDDEEERRRRWGIQQLI